MAIRYIRWNNFLLQYSHKALQKNICIRIFMHKLYKEIFFYFLHKQFKFQCNQQTERKLHAFL